VTLSPCLSLGLVIQHQKLSPSSFKKTRDIRRSIFPSLFSHIQTVTPIDRKTRTPEQLTHIHNHGKDLPGHRDWIQRGENGDNLETLRLIFTNKQLEDSSVLSSYGIQNQSVIQLVMRVPGGWRH
uniref:Ubiquitin-like domain-containing protein n=1 Tax=Oncorhynchus kisutch TaxID=8019 RepID=A0A8C7G454_ONCKI